MRLKYAKVKKFGESSLAIIRAANAICAEYEAQGFDLTLRQLYYQFVSRDLISNNMREYKRLGSIINDARLAGMLDWDYIVDRTRNVQSVNHFDNPAHIVDVAARSYANDKWVDQPTRVEVWIEKDALIGVIEGVCRDNDVEHFSCRGYVSQSEMWSAGQRMFRRAMEHNQRTVILHLGDHDPSGIDMTRDIEERLRNFCHWDFARHVQQEMLEQDTLAIEQANEDRDELTDEEWDALWYTGYRDDSNTLLMGERAKEELHRRIIEFMRDMAPVVERIALTMDQVEEYGPPPNPAKLTDSRSTPYVEQYGYESWELDALDPATLAALIRDNIDEHRDEQLWEAAVEHEEEGRERLMHIVRTWTDEIAS